MGPDEPFSSGRILIVAAHSDDETIGTGGQLPEWSDRVSILHATDGAPLNLDDAHRAGVETREEYSALRRREMLSAVALAGVPAERCLQVGLTDQTASHNLAKLATAIDRFVSEIRPAIVLTHPYEGGHPDHDSVAFAVATAANKTETPVYEFTSYHAGRSGLESGKFLPGGPEPRLYRLAESQKQKKREMFDCFGSQAHMLVHFGLETESFRPAPQYDFSKPPHPGRLHYEQFDWGVTGAQWRELAASALSDLGLELHATNRS